MNVGKYLADTKRKADIAVLLKVRDEMEEAKRRIAETRAKLSRWGG